MVHGFKNTEGISWRSLRAQNIKVKGKSIMIGENENRLIGVFLGMTSSSYEYIASIISPYQASYSPKIGSFILIDNGFEEFVIARIMNLLPRGELTTFMGEKWLSEVALFEDSIGQDIKQRKISYNVKIKLLGRYLKKNNKFNPGILKIPHITSRVYSPSLEMIRVICNTALEEQSKGITIGHFHLNDEINIKFDIDLLMGKRTFIFARAGYGKSNLMKLLASNWKHENGALFIFDPEGEYSITDKKGRPGILDHIPAILITNRKKIVEKVPNNIYPNLKFNLKLFHPRFIIPILLPESKKETIFFKKLMSMDQNQWGRLVDLLMEKKWLTSTKEIGEILELGNVQENDPSISGIPNNLVAPIKRLHDPNSKLLQILELAAHHGYVTNIDISLLDSHNALIFCSIIVSHFFKKNQQVFIEGKESLSKIVFVMEEAQSVLSASTGISSFVELAKEGRKYQLGGIFITQQPSSIANEIISQADNFFVFHMISKSDLVSLNKANAHYSEDILTQILNEPTRGKCYYWSSPQPFVIPVQILNFEAIAQSNKAPEIQGQNDLLQPISKEINDNDLILSSIQQKLKQVLTKHDFNAPNKSVFDTLKKTIVYDLIQLLDANEKKYLIDQGHALIGERDGAFYGIKYSIISFWVDNLLKNP